jgi:predicted peroxiredoxin
MAKYVLIESRDAFEHGDASYFCNTAKDLASAGNEVTMFLVQNAVLMARKGAQRNPIESILKGRAKVQVLADDFCLQERAIKSSALLPGIGVSNVDHLADLLAQDGVKAIWH